MESDTGKVLIRPPTSQSWSLLSEKQILYLFSYSDWQGIHSLHSMPIPATPYSGQVRGLGAAVSTRDRGWGFPFPRNRHLICSVPLPVSTTDSDSLF